MADFVYVDKENTSQVNFMSRPQHAPLGRGIIGKNFQNTQASSQLIRKVLGDVNRESAVRTKPSDMLAKNMAVKKQQQVMNKKPWKILKPAVPASKPSKSKEKCPSVQAADVAIVPEKMVDTHIEDIEQMHLPPNEPDTYEDIWACDFPIIPDGPEDESSDEDSLISESDDDLSSFVVRDYDLEEPEKDDVELSLETMPSIQDIPLPPLEDLLPNSLDFYTSLS